jgi:viroplasmin and RNaseH domain-containing protein
VVFRGGVPGIYSSWRIFQDQVSGYSNNSYKEYEILKEAQQEYHNFLNHEAMVVEAINQLVPLAHLPSETVHALQGAPDVRHSRVKEYIIVFLIAVIMRILFF